LTYGRRNSGDRRFFNIVTAAVLFVPLLVLLFIAVLVAGAAPALAKFGWGFLTSKTWDANAEGGPMFGALPFIYGTIVTAVAALLIAAPVGIATATFLAEIVGPKVRGVIAFLLEILATIPSVVYGMWGLFILAPWIAEHVQPYARDHLQPLIDSVFGVSKVGRRMVPNFPLFWYPGYPNGLGLGTAVLVLSIMILPMIVSLSLDALQAVPKSYREAALGLGATRWEMIRIAVWPPARSGLFGACILALGRALGETMAVTMVIGNDTRVAYSIFGKGYSIASIIANEYGEADDANYKLPALMALALILFLITLAVNLLARLFVRKPVTTNAPRFRPFHTAARYTGLVFVTYWIGRGWGALRDGLLRLLHIGNTAFRRFKNRLVLAAMAVLVVLCLIPLAALLYALLHEGGRYISLTFLSHLPKPPGEIGGGVGNAILGSTLLLLFSAVFAVPLGLALGIYLTQKPSTKLAALTRLLLDVLSGIPAIIVGVFVYAVVVRKTGFSMHVGLSTLAGAMALAMIMLPIFARASEEALKSIPKTVDEAGLGLGLPRRTVVLRILVRAAMPAILTGLFLALARVGGEAAPLLFTTQSSSFWPDHSTTDLVQLKPLLQPVASLPLVIFEYSKSPYEDWKAQAWGASLVLVTMVLAIRLSTRAYTAWRYGAKAAHV
jgi:phosphate transport system permease protein